MPGRERKGKQDIFLRQCRRQRSCLHIVTHKNNIFRLIRPQGFQSRIQLRISQNDKYHIVPDIRCQFRHHRNIADRCAEGELLILDPQSVLPDFLCQFPRASRVTSFRRETDSLPDCTLKHLHHIPEFSLLASKSDLYNLHLHHSVTDPGEKTEKSADGWVFQIGVAQHIPRPREPANGYPMAPISWGRRKPRNTRQLSLICALLSHVFAIIFTAVRLAASNTSTPPGKASAMARTNVLTCSVRK